MKRKWIAAVSICLCLVAFGVLYTTGSEESSALASPEAKQTEQPIKEQDQQPEKEKPGGSGASVLASGITGSDSGAECAEFLVLLRDGLSAPGSEQRWQFD